jgi:hypothetical protein
MNTTFKAGDTVYDIHGQAGSYVARTAGGHIVEPMYDADGDEEPHFDDAVTWREVFAAPPTARLHAEVATIEQQLATARAELQTVRNERHASDQEHRERLNRLKKYTHLTRLDDYLEGRITHFVTYGRYSNDISVQTFDQVMKGDRSRSVPLLVLYGDYSDTAMRDTHWSLINSENVTKVMPCASLEEAMTKAQIEVEKVFAAWRTDPKGSYGHSGLLAVARAAQKVGLVVPEDVLAECAARDAATLTSQLTSRRAELAKVQAAVDEAEKQLRAAA